LKENIPVLNPEHLRLSIHDDNVRTNGEIDMRRPSVLKRLFGTSLLVVMALGTIAVALPTPTASACLYCVPYDCPPCYAMTGGSCFRCPSCKKIPGCKV